MQTGASRRERITFVGAKTIALYSNDCLYLEGNIANCCVYKLYHIMGIALLIDKGFEMSLKTNVQNILRLTFFERIFSIFSHFIKIFTIRHIHDIKEIKIKLFIMSVCFFYA